MKQTTFGNGTRHSMLLNLMDTEREMQHGNMHSTVCRVTLQNKNFKERICTLSMVTQNYKAQAIKGAECFRHDVHTSICFQQTIRLPLYRNTSLSICNFPSREQHTCHISIQAVLNHQISFVIPPGIRQH